MPRLKTTAKLERNAAADLWKHTLSRIPTLIGRLVYLASLRDVNSGTYQHYGLVAAFGIEEAANALKQSHLEAFRQWLNLALAAKNDDLRDHFATLEDPQPHVVEHWLQAGVYRRCVPPSAKKMEIDLFCRDLETLLAVYRNEAVKRRPLSGA